LNNIENTKGIKRWKD